MNTKIFLSYRRNDSSPFTEQFHDALSQRYDLKEVFWDRRSIAPGRDFPTVIQQSLLECKVVIVVIGNDWLSATDIDGKRRLDKPDDYVHLEIKAALQLDKIVIPLLINGERMPNTDELPTDIAGLATRNSFTISAGATFNSDLQQLYRHIDRQFNGPTNAFIGGFLGIALLMYEYANSKTTHLTGAWIDFPVIYCWVVVYCVGCLVAIGQAVQDKHWGWVAAFMLPLTSMATFFIVGLIQPIFPLWRLDIALSFTVESIILGLFALKGPRRKPRWHTPEDIARLNPN